MEPHKTYSTFHTADTLSQLQRKLVVVDSKRLPEGIEGQDRGAVKAALQSRAELLKLSIEGQFGPSTKKPKLCALWLKKSFL
ncbi:hypothetical protein ACOJCM_15610 [Billgrantia sp. LNSP4103-1]|uniref:hypothetical protein n=1 Tax=Billgrantia sp. LNSP4103-1 TaxID=3410266 RepID=UPI00403F8F49